VDLIDKFFLSVIFSALFFAQSFFLDSGNLITNPFAKDIRVLHSYE